MKVAVSYFAQIRNFKPNMIPISTAIYDPKWYHDNKGTLHKFIDKRGVLNGVRCIDLAPGEACSGLCSGAKDCKHTPDMCAFLHKYKEQLDAIDKEGFKDYCERVLYSCYPYLGVNKDDVILVFMVYEKYDNPCSERAHLLNFLRECGFDADELTYPIV